MFNLDSCIFCSEPETEIVAENDLARAFYDKYPVNEGHVLIVPKRHVETLFEATLEELDAINRLLFKVKDKLDKKFNPDGYNVGVNVGRAAGQTIFHLHYHVIPRYLGDVKDPRGGIRKIKKSVIPYLAEGEEN
nr:HIT family protein [Calderihabitans maritimus]